MPARDARTSNHHHHRRRHQAPLYRHVHGFSSQPRKTTGAATRSARISGTKTSRPPGNASALADRIITRYERRSRPGWPGRGYSFNGVVKIGAIHAHRTTLVGPPRNFLFYFPCVKSPDRFIPRRRRHREWKTFYATNGALYIASCEHKRLLNY